MSEFDIEDTLLVREIEIKSLDGHSFFGRCGRQFKVYFRLPGDPPIQTKRLFVVKTYLVHLMGGPNVT